MPASPPTRPLLPGLTPRHQRLALIVAACSCGWLIPWSAWLAATLSRRPGAQRSALEWAALDLAEAGAAGTTAWFLHRGDRRAAWSAAIFAALLVLDAGVDTATAESAPALGLAVGEALAVELPLAAAAGHLAWRVLRRSGPPQQASVHRGAAGVDGTAGLGVRA